MFRCPFVIYADKESLIVKSNEESKGNTKKTHEHKMLSYGYKIVSAYPEYTKEYKSFVQQNEHDNVANRFIKSLLDEYKWINNI